MIIRTPLDNTLEALKRIGQFYSLEAELRGMSAEQRLAERQQRAKPLLQELETWLRDWVEEDGGALPPMGRRG